MSSDAPAFCPSPSLPLPAAHASRVLQPGAPRHVSSDSGTVRLPGQAPSPPPRTGTAARGQAGSLRRAPKGGCCSGGGAPSPHCRCACVPLPPTRPTAEWVVSASQFLNGELFSCCSFPAQSGEPGKQNETPPAGQGAGTERCHGGPGPAAARKLLPSLQQHRHRGREAKSFVCRFLSSLRAAGATAPERSPSSPPSAAGDIGTYVALTPPRLTSAHPPAPSTRVPKFLPLLPGFTARSPARGGAAAGTGSPAGRNLVCFNICLCIFPAAQTPIHEFLEPPSFSVW